METDIKTKLYLRRKELGLTLEEVGNMVGVGKSTVRKWETGDIENMKRDKIALLAKALQVSPAYIMGWTDTAEITPTDRSAKLAVKIRKDIDAIELLEAYYSLSNEKKAIAKNMIKVLMENNS